MFVGSLPMKNRKTLAHGVFGTFATCAGLVYEITIATYAGLVYEITISAIYAGLVYEITIAKYAGLVYEITIQCHICRPCL